MLPLQWFLLLPVFPTIVQTSMGRGAQGHEPHPTRAPLPPKKTHFYLIFLCISNFKGKALQAKKEKKKGIEKMFTRINKSIF